MFIDIRFKRHNKNVLIEVDGYETFVEAVYDMANTAWLVVGSTAYSVDTIASFTEVTQPGKSDEETGD